MPTKNIAIKKGDSISDFQRFVNQVYVESNNRHFNVEDMLTNIQRYLMRGIKGIRKGNKWKTLENLMISFSWFMSLVNRHGIEIEDTVWKRFPYLCSYCGEQPCSCKKNKIQSRQKVKIDDKKRPKSIKGFQEMFNQIYPADTRTLEHAGIHLAEEIGELSEAFLVHKNTHKSEDFANIVLEASDLVSCYMGVFNSFGIDLEEEMIKYYKKNCPACHKSPCECTFETVMTYKS